MTSDHVCYIVPPHVLIQMIDDGSPDLRTSAVRTLAISERVRERAPESPNPTGSPTR